MINAISGKEIKNPPVGPTNLSKPPEKLASTGTPTAPSNKYTTQEIVESFAPNTTAASVIANVCMVIGTPIGIGMEICAMTAITAVNNPT